MLESEDLGCQVFTDMGTGVGILLGSLTEVLPMPLQDRLIETC